MGVEWGMGRNNTRTPLGWSNYRVLPSIFSGYPSWEIPELHRSFPPDPIGGPEPSWGVLGQLVGLSTATTSSECWSSGRVLCGVLKVSVGSPPHWFSLVVDWGSLVGCSSVLCLVKTSAGCISVLRSNILFLLPWKSKCEWGWVGLSASAKTLICRSGEMEEGDCICLDPTTTLSCCRPFVVWDRGMKEDNWGIGIVFGFGGWSD